MASVSIFVHSIGSSSPFFGFSAGGCQEHWANARSCGYDWRVAAKFLLKMEVASSRILDVAQGRLLSRVMILSLTKTSCSKFTHSERD